MTTSLGDLPTWLGVVAASVAATFVYLKLRSQNAEFKRQVRILERQQADQVDLILAFGGASLMSTSATGCGTRLSPLRASAGTRRE